MHAQYVLRPILLHAYLRAILYHAGFEHLLANMHALNQVCSEATVHAVTFDHSFTYQHIHKNASPRESQYNQVESLVRV